jgi:hypothetical protein
MWAMERAEMAPRASASAINSVELGGAEAVEQLGETGGVTGERLAAPGQGVDESIGVSTRAAQTVTTTELVRTALDACERCDVRGILDDGATVEEAGAGPGSCRARRAHHGGAVAGGRTRTRRSREALVRSR